MADTTLIKNVADWTEDATLALKSFDPRIFNWIGDPDGPPYEIGWVSQEGVPYIPPMFPTFPNTALLIERPVEMTVYLHKAVLEIDTRVTALEAAAGGTVVEVPLPTWDMDAVSTMMVAHGQANKEAIRNIFLRVRNDADDRFYMLYDRDYIWWDDTDVEIKRGGELNKMQFSSTSFSRGTMYLVLA